LYALHWADIAEKVEASRQLIAAGVMTAEDVRWNIAIW